MTCPECGHAVSETDHFCAACGRDLMNNPLEHTGMHTVVVPGDPNSTGLPSAVGSGQAQDIPRGGALLIVHRGPGEGTEFPLSASADVVGVGRAPESDVFLDDVTVSRRHAEFRRGAEGWSVRDVGSLNGTYVNRVRIEDQKLTGGEEVQIGKFRFIFLVGLEG